MKANNQISAWIRDLRTANIFAQKVLRSTKIDPIERKANSPSSRLSKLVGHFDWNMTTHVTIDGIVDAMPYSMSLTLTFQLALKPLQIAAIAMDGLSSNSISQAVEALSPHIDHELKQLLIEAAAPISGGILTSYKMEELIVGTESLETLTIHKPQNDTIILRLVMGEVVFDFHHYLVPLVENEVVIPFVPNRQRFLNKIHVPITLFNHEGLIHRSFEWQENVDNSTVTTNVGAHWMPLKRS